MSGDKKTKWEAWLTPEDHATAEEQRKIFGLTRAAYTRAALQDRRVIEAECVAQMVGITGRVLCDLDAARQSSPHLGPLLDPMIADLREAILLGAGDAA